MSRSESNKNAEEFNFKPSMSNDSNKNAEEFEYPMSSDSNKNSEEFEKIRKMRDDPFFEDFFLKKSEKDEDDDDDDPRKEFSGFSKTDFHEEKDPLKMSESPKMNYPEVFHHIKEKSEEIRRNYENSNFLSDYGSGDRPMSEVKVLRYLKMFGLKSFCSNLVYFCLKNFVRIWFIFVKRFSFVSCLKVSLLSALNLFPST